MSSSKNPLLSILIATKNRIPYCIQVIETILEFPDQDFELIIQDNSDSNELSDYAKHINILKILDFYIIIHHPLFHQLIILIKQFLFQRGNICVLLEMMTVLHLKYLVL